MKVQDLVEPVRFASGRSDIRLEQVDVLRQTIESLKDKRNLRLHFIGHTDNQQLSARSRAKYGDNYGLALDRAQQVAEMFRLELGLPAHMITFEGMGADHPLESNDTSEGMALNRRVEIEIRYEDVSETETEIEERSVVPAPPTVEKVMHLEDGSTLWTTEDPYLLDPRLAVVAVDPLFVRERQVAQPVRFRLYSNYAAFIARWELAIYAGTDVDRIAPLATLSGDKLDNAGEVAWDGAPLTAKQLRDNDALSYVLRVYSADGAVDETAPRPLEITSHATGYDAAQAGKDALDKVYGANMLAKQQIKIVGSRVRIHGEGLPANRSLSINGARAVIDEQGRFAVEQVLPLGTNVLKLELVDEAGQRWTRDLAVDVAGEHFFMVGIADLTVGQNSVSGSVEPLSADDHFDEEVFADGRVAFYLKGKVRGRYLITAQLDTEEGELKDIFKDLDRKDPRVMFRQLDPDRYYPVYGDDSTVIDDTDSQGKMFVKVQWDRSHALWGNFNTGFTGNELAQYNRSLYGAKAQYRSESDTRYGDPRTEVSGFVSQPQTALAHNEFRSTGASLYYLKHTQVVQGSEKVRAEVRARDGERVLQNITLERGRDYDFDDLQGRIILLRPLTMVGAMAAPSIIKDMPLDGDQVYLVVDYEYVTSDFDTDELAYGARAKTWLDDKLALGGTYVHENRNGADHEIRGVDVTARLGRGTYLKGEYAQSEATQSQTGVLSTDGGLSFGNLDASSGITEGNAYGVEGRVNLGEMTEGARDGSAGVWVKQRDAGFANASLGKGVETREAGAEGEMKVSEDLTLAARGTVYDRDGVGKDQKLSVQAEMRAGESTKITGELGAVSESPAAGDERTATLGAVKLGHDLSDDVNIYGVLQLTLTHNDAYAQNNLATLGTKAKLTDKLGVQAEASSGSRGHAATVGMDYVFMDSHSLYTAYSSSVDRTDGHKDVLTVGQRIGLSDRTRVFHENQFSDSDRQAGVAHVFGLDFDASKTLRLGASVQSSRIDDDVSGGIERDAFTLTLQHRDLNTSISSKLEFRFDHGSDEKRQWLTTNNVRHKLSEEYTWLGKLNLSHTDDRSDARDDARFAEIGVGLAYRPIDWNRLNLIGKYTYLHDLPSEAQTPNQTDERAHVLALESLYDLDQRWTLGGKLATKRSELRADRDAGAWYTTRTHLAAANLRYHFIRNWDGLAEYRWLAVQEAEDSRHGLLLSISRHIGDHLQLGVGYNFSQFNDDLTNLDYDAQGWFINLVGSY